MTMPGFTAEASLVLTEIRNWQGQWLNTERKSRLLLAAGPGPSCSWWQWVIAPIACGFVEANIATGTAGYGPSRCTWWQWWADPAGCSFV